MKSWWLTFSEPSTTDEKEHFLYLSVAQGEKCMRFEVRWTACERGRVRASAFHLLSTGEKTVRAEK